MQPRIIDPRSASQRMAQAAAGNPPNPGNENPSKILQSTDRLQPRFLYNPYGPSSDTCEQTFDGNTTRNDNENDHIEVGSIYEMAIFCHEITSDEYHL